MTTARNEGVSIRPSDMVSGGLVDNVNATIREARFAVWDYGGRSPQPVLAVKIDIATDDGVAATQYYSAGDTRSFAPSTDGRRVVSVGSQTNLNDNTNLAFFLKGLINAGFPENRLTDDISVLEGLHGFWQRVAAPDRPGLVRTTRADQEVQRPPTILIVTKIDRMPWEGAPAAPSASAAAAGAGRTSRSSRAAAAAPVAAPAAPRTATWKAPPRICLSPH